MSTASTSRRILPLLLALSSLVLISPIEAVAASSPVQRQFSGGTGWTRLRGSVSPGLEKAHRLGQLSGTRQIDLTVALKVREGAALEAFLKDVYDPSSPSYHHFLTPQEFAQRFGPDSATRDEVSSWLQSHGLQVRSISSNGLLVTAEGTAASAGTAFDTPIDSFKQGDRTFYANTQPVRLPETIAGDVVAVSGLSTSAQQDPAPGAHAVTEAAPRGYSPAEIQQVYDMTPLLNRGITGAGQTIAIAGFADYADSNIAAYDRQFGLPTNVTRIKVSDGRSTGGELGEKNGQSESEMDIELVQAAAPQATVLMYEAPNSSQGALRLYNRIVSDNRAPVITTSWGGEESTYTDNELNGMHQILQEAAAQGQALFAASGDNGAYDGVGTPGGSSGLSVDYPASDPWTTGVGGTTLQSNNGQYISEVAWADPSSRRVPVGSGGGLSTIFSRPSYQAGPGVINQYSNGQRQVPDVSLDADPATGYAIYTVTSRGGASWGQAGGTSAAAPVWAGFATLVNAALGRRIGPLNPTLYSLGQHASQFSRAPFHDVTDGDNLYYPATSGWDFATGWGSFDADAFVADVSALGTSTSTPTAMPTSVASPTAANVNISKVILLHKVNGSLKQTSSLKVGETGTLVVLYKSTNTVGRVVTGTVAVRQKGKVVKTITLKGATYNGTPALAATVKFTSAQRVGTLQAQVKVMLGALSAALTYPLKLVPAK